MSEAWTREFYRRPYAQHVFVDNLDPEMANIEMIGLTLGSLWMDASRDLAHVLVGVENDDPCCGVWAEVTIETIDDVMIMQACRHGNIDLLRIVASHKRRGGLQLEPRHVQQLAAVVMEHELGVKEIMRRRYTCLDYAMSHGVVHWQWKTLAMHAGLGAQLGYHCDIARRLMAGYLLDRNGPMDKCQLVDDTGLSAAWFRMFLSIRRRGIVKACTILCAQLMATRRRNAAAKIIQTAWVSHMLHPDRIGVRGSALFKARQRFEEMN